VDGPTAFGHLRLVVTEAAGEGDLSLAELELLAEQDEGDDVVPLATGAAPDATARAEARAAEQAAEAARAVSVSAIPVCEAGEGALRVLVDGVAGTSVTVASDFGTERLRGSGDLTFEAGSARFGTGAVSAVVTATVDGERTTERLTIPYEATSCG
jgi:hypothetical protein